MLIANRVTIEDLPDLPHSRQLKAGFDWLTFDADLEAEFRRSHLDENLRHIRINLCLALTITLALSAMEARLLGPSLFRVPSLIHMLVMVPMLLVCLAATFSTQPHRLYALCAPVACATLGLSVLAIQLIVLLAGVSIFFPCLLLTSMFVYFMGGLVFYQALAANLLVLFAFLGAGTVLQLPAQLFGYDAMCLVAANLFAASVVYMHEKTSRLRFLESALLREMVARDGLTGIQNRRMFDQHIPLAWQNAVREGRRIAVILIDVDCFKHYNDRYGHQAGDECLRAVAAALSRSARRPRDFVARYGGEEFAVVLYDASREYLAEVSTRIQRSIADLNIPHDASPVAGRVTVSIGAAFSLPSVNRSYEGLIQLADEALYGAKEQGRNGIVTLDAEHHMLRTGRFTKRRALASAANR
jgi:diguanylate cyclase (GGDEF)-like protein